MAKYFFVLTNKLVLLEIPHATYHKNNVVINEADEMKLRGC
jgi:hypothetical protein